MIAEQFNQIVSEHTPLEQQLLTTLKGVGPKLASRLQKLGLNNLADLLWHLPVRYQNRTQIIPIAQLQAGMEAVIEATVQQTELVGQRRMMLLCHVQDDSGSLTLRFFHFTAAQHRALANGTRLRCFGEVRSGHQSLEMFHPEYKYLQEEQDAPEPYLTAIYPTTEGVHQATLRSLLKQVLARINDTSLPELLPTSLRQRLKLMPLAEAIKLLHQPPPADEALILQARHPAQQRLVFEELLAHQLSLRQLRYKVRQHQAAKLIGKQKLRTQFLASLPFQPTAAQNRVSAEIDQDLSQPLPMMRLVQGDVGSGKTLVAALAILRAIGAGYQTALMAPTELLAEQHYQTFSNWFAPLGLEIVWLSGKIKGKARQQALQLLRAGTAQLAVGTHALFQEEVIFHKLGLVIIDEQHRFGVHQRLALREKGRRGGFSPHQLIMTATPIPRTLAMSAYADLDTSIIDELPPGRTPVTTVAVAANRRDEVIERIRKACQAGRQAYWVCTLIEESDVLQAEAAEDTANLLAERLPKLQIGLVHGRMKSADKEALMADFKAAKINLLVATTVIEVGVDVPRASLMIIENPERLGLAQLHQLRGRVGRGKVTSHCVLLYQSPLSEQARARLQILRASNDGFEIARRDLELRGPGEVLGTRQTGDMNFRIADLLRDEHQLPQVQKIADILLEKYPQDATTIQQRWLGQNQEYGQV